MVDWLKYAVRMAATLLLVMCCILSLVTAFAAKDGRTTVFVIAAIFGAAGIFTWPRRPNAWRSDPPTERQIAFAKDLGIQVRRGMSKGQLSDLITEAKAVRDSM